MIKRLFENFVIKLTDWLFRVRPIERFLLASGFSGLAVVGGPPLVLFMLCLISGIVPELDLPAQPTINAVQIWILLLCSIVIVFALGLIFFRTKSEARTRSKKRVLVIEGRGLRDDDGSPLEQIVKKEVEGQIIPILLDLRNRLDGKVIEPEGALAEISSIHRSMLQHRKNVDRCDLTIVYGGLTSVPYTFLTGVLLDDEGDIRLFDWDRSQEIWRSLNVEDNDSTFKVSGVEDATGAEDVVIALAFSYPIDDKDLQSTFSYPVVRLTLEDMSSDAHWSQKKQNRLAQQFLEIAKKLSAHGVKRIHLVMAAPNSVVFTFGRRYDKRNLPELIVYQFERGRELAYPWGVVMPVAGISQPKIHCR